MEVRRDKASIYARAMSTAVFRLAPTTEKKKINKTRTDTDRWPDAYSACTDHDMVATHEATLRQSAWDLRLPPVLAKPWRVASRVGRSRQEVREGLALSTCIRASDGGIRHR